MELTTLLIVCPLVFLAGFVDAIAGGGGLISLPGYLIAGLPPIQAVGTNKLASSIGTSAATFRMWRGGYINFKLGVPAAIFAILGSIIGAHLVLITPEHYLKTIMLVIMPFVAVFVLRKKTFRDTTDPNISFRRQVIMISLWSFIVGCYDGFYGPGAGTFMLIAFTVGVKLSIKEASGEVKVANLASNIAALITFLMNGVVWVELGLIAAVFSLIGSYLGAGCIMKDGTKVVRPIIIVVLTILSIKIILELTGVI